MRPLLLFALVGVTSPSLLSVRTTIGGAISPRAPAVAPLELVRFASDVRGSLLLDDGGSIDVDTDEGMLAVEDMLLTELASPDTRRGMPVDCIGPSRERGRYMMDSCWAMRSAAAPRRGDDSDMAVAASAGEEELPARLARLR